MARCGRRRRRGNQTADRAATTSAVSQPTGSGHALHAHLTVEVEGVDADQQRVGLSAEDAGDIALTLGPLREDDRVAPRRPASVRVEMLNLEADVAEALLEPGL